jgi:hypothetical protein
MYRSAQRRTGPRISRNRRITAVAIVLVVFGALITVSRVSSAKVQRTGGSAANCGPAVPGANAPNGQNTTTTQQNGRNVRNHWGDGQEKPAGCPSASPSASSSSNAQTVNCPSVAQKLPRVPSAAKTEVDAQLAQLDTQIADANNRLAATKGQAGSNAVNSILNQLKSKRTATIGKIVAAIDRVAARPNGLDALAACKAVAANNGGANNGGAKLNILADKCKGGSKLQLHDGFQNGDRCVDTEMGEVGTADQNPSLLITQAPDRVKVNQPFTIKVSTRNLIRDRFLAAGQGGYYVEMSKLDAKGLVRGHFHTACRMLDSTKVAPDPAPVPAFFVATEDKGGSARPDTIVIQVPGLPQKGIAQCASWAGDGSHRVPMMQRANQIPAIDTVRIDVN